MLIALNENGTRIRASPKISAVCPLCSASVIPKCGTINIHHWSHKPNSDCRHGEGMGEWHMRLQQHALYNGGDVEVIIPDNHDNYQVADIVYKKRVIELQHSSISPTEILKRSYFFCAQKYLVDWILDYRANNFIHISETRITANGFRKRRFDCLFNKGYGKILFDIDNNMFFYVQNRNSETWWESNDFGSVRKHLEIYNGFKTNSFLNPLPIVQILPHIAFDENQTNIFNF